MDQLLCEISEAAIFVPAYADDVIIIFRANDKKIVLNLMRFALRIVEKWCEKVKLSVNPSKAEVLLSTNRYKNGSTPELTMFSREIKFGKEAR